MPKTGDNKKSSNSKQFYLQRHYDYGVEIEAVLAFHEEELDLSSPGQSAQKTLVKDLSYGAREVEPFTPNHPGAKVYRSWAVAEGDGGPRPYKQEPLKILEKKINAKFPNLDFKVLNSIPSIEKTTDLYNSWTITNDPSVVGAGEQRICEEIPPATKCPKSWDSYGIELVSPVVKSLSNQREIRDVTDFMTEQKEESYGLFTTNQCALQVHVGLSEFKVIQKLALLCLVYEEEISRLHPPCRRHGKRAQNESILSNRLGLLAPGQHVPSMRIDCSTSAIMEKGITISNLEELMGPDCRTTIGETKLEYLFNKGELAKLMNYPPVNRRHQYTMGDRNRFVNFTTCARMSFQPSTIEFRQHRGTLSIEDIEAWVEFVVNLVKLAAYYADNPEQFPVQDWEDATGGSPRNGKRKRVRVFDLMDEMELPRAKRILWEEKVARYMCSEEGGLDDRSDNEPEPADYGSSSPERGSDITSSLSAPGSEKVPSSRGHSNTPDPVRQPGPPGQPESSAQTIAAGVWATEHFTFDGFTWVVTNFNIDEWLIEQTDTRVGRLGNMCGINALLQSFQAQYPDSEYADPQNLDKYVAMARSIQPNISRKEGVSDDTMEKLISQLTNDEYRLIRVDYSGARRWDESGRGGPGKSLYIYISGHDPFKQQEEAAAKTRRRRGRVIENPYPMGHWESMRRKPGVKEHA